MVGLNAQVGAQHEVEGDNPSVVGERIALVALVTVVDILIGFVVELHRVLTVCDRRGKSEEDEVVRGDEDEPEPVELNHTSEGALLFLRDQVIDVLEFVIFFLRRIL